MISLRKVLVFLSSSTVESGDASEDFSEAYRDLQKDEGLVLSLEKSQCMLFRTPVVYIVDKMVIKCDHAR